MKCGRRKLPPQGNAQEQQTAFWQHRLRYRVCLTSRNIEIYGPHPTVFYRSTEYDQICSKPRRSAMVTAWVRSLARSLSTKFLMWKLIVVSEIDS